MGARRAEALKVGWRAGDRNHPMPIPIFISKNEWNGGA